MKASNAFTRDLAITVAVVLTVVLIGVHMALTNAKSKLSSRNEAAEVRDEAE